MKARCIDNGGQKYIHADDVFFMQDKLQQRLKEAEKVIKFYGDKDSWISVNQHRSTLQKIKNKDLGRADLSQMYFVLCGGKRAREYQSKYKGGE